MKRQWQVYIIRCSDNSFYTGITTDCERRFRQHAEGKGAKYFRGRQPVEIVYLENGHSRGTASRRELQIKRLSHPEKALLVSSERNQSHNNQEPPLFQAGGS